MSVYFISTPSRTPPSCNSWFREKFRKKRHICSHISTNNWPMELILVPKCPSHRLLQRRNYQIKISGRKIQKRHKKKSKILGLTLLWMVMPQELLGLETPFVYQNAHKTVLYKHGRGLKSSEQDFRVNDSQIRFFLCGKYRFSRVFIATMKFWTQPGGQSAI